jgi:hypothetical protein
MKYSIKQLRNMIEKEKRVPPDFDQWEDLKIDRNGTTIAHLAAQYGCLPPDFNSWYLRDNRGWTVAHDAAYYNHLPSDFNQWDLANDGGWTVAHIAAYYNHLPSDFNQWNLADNDGWTVAHEAAYYNHLPSDFNQWEIADNDGWTVAHEAAYYNHLPSDFNQWELADNDGMTVAQLAYEYNHLPPDFDRWDLIKKDSEDQSMKKMTFNDIVVIGIDRFQTPAEGYVDFLEDEKKIYSFHPGQTAIWLDYANGEIQPIYGCSIIDTTTIGNSNISLLLLTEYALYLNKNSNIYNMFYKGKYIEIDKEFLLVTGILPATSKFKRVELPVPTPEHIKQTIDNLLNEATKQLQASDYQPNRNVQPPQFQSVIEGYDPTP